MFNLTYVAPWYPYQPNGSNLRPFRDRIAAIIIDRFVPPSEVAQFRDQRRERDRQHRALAAHEQGGATEEIELSP